MKLIKEGAVTPDFLASIKTDSNIVMCVPPIESNTVKELTSFPDMFGIFLSRDINLSSADVQSISSGVLSVTHRPKIKMSFPVGIQPMFSDFIENDKQDIFWKIYRSFEFYNTYKKDEILDHNIIENISFNLYVDTIRLRNMGLNTFLKKDTCISEFFFNWYVQTKAPMDRVDEIYLIIDSQVYEDFLTIF